MTTNNDLTALETEPAKITLTTGQEVLIERLRTRQLFRLLKVVTRGAAPILSELAFSADTPEDQFASQLLGVILVSVPEAEDEAIEFIRSMVSPLNLVSPERSKDDKQKNLDEWAALNVALVNPELEDTLSIIRHVISTEAPHIQSLGKQLTALLPGAAAAASLKTSSKKP